MFRAGKFVVVDIVAPGAGLAGTWTGFERMPQLRPEDRLALAGDWSKCQFVPSNPCSAMRWRNRADVAVDLSRVMQRKDVLLVTEGLR